MFVILAIKKYTYNLISHQRCEKYFLKHIFLNVSHQGLKNESLFTLTRTFELAQGARVSDLRLRARSLYHPTFVHRLLKFKVLPIKNCNLVLMNFLLLIFVPYFTIIFIRCYQTYSLFLVFIIQKSARTTKKQS